nr:MAG TPA: hypothetical protein [Caudoviricetes sp.]
MYYDIRAILYLFKNKVIILYVQTTICSDTLILPKRCLILAKKRIILTVLLRVRLKRRISLEPKAGFLSLQ